MMMPLPLRFHGDDTRVAVEADPGHEPLRDFFVRDLGLRITTIARTRALLSSGDPYLPWQSRYRYHVLDYDGAMVHVRALDGNGPEYAVHPAVLDACLVEYLELVGLAEHRRTLEHIKAEGGLPRFVPDRELPVSFRILEPGRIECRAAPGHEGHLAGLLGSDDVTMLPVLDWLLDELDHDDPAVTWPGPVYTVQVTGATTLIGTMDGSITSLDTETFRQALAAYKQALFDSFATEPPQLPPAFQLSETGTGPGPAVMMLALGRVAEPVWGWGLLQTSHAALTEVAGLVPHPDDCLPRGVMGAGTGVYWADLAMKDHGTGRVWTGTKTFLPRRVDGVRVMTDLVGALMADDAAFIPGIPGAWTGVVADVPGHGYLDPNGVGRLPVEPEAAGIAAGHIRVFFPVMGCPPPEQVMSLVDGLPGVTGRRYVLAAFLLQDVQCHRHHIGVLRAAEPGWEHTGNACHLIRGAESVRLEHLWLDGRSCELPVADFHAVLDAYEALL
ncbi:hypothetical protein [Actinomadura sp. SCN-SB]|uniref:hypothetical protein n=1 Tax=Actinomadura sp. SCN-SB TaxID=3373092 RepID=UPI00375247C1